MRYDIRTKHVYLGDDADSTFEVGDDEFVIDSDWRNPNRVVLAIATPLDTLDETLCQHVKDDGEQCTREPNEGAYCWQH